MNLQKAMNHQIKAETENFIHQKIILLYSFWHSDNEIPLHNLEEKMPRVYQDHKIITAFLITRYIVFASLKNDTKRIKMDYIFEISATNIH